MTNKTPFVFLASLSVFSLFTFDLYQPALPAMTTYFNTSQALGQLTLSLYLFIFGLSQLVWGPLIDHFGRRRTLPISLVLFLAATLFCILSNGIEMLIIARAVQSFAVCCSIVIAFSSSRDLENSTERAKMLSHLSMILSTSPIVAPLLGSLMLILFDWQATFVLMALLGLFLLTLSYFLLSESPNWLRIETPFLLKNSLKTYFALLQHRRLWVGIIITTASFSTSMIVVINSSYLIIGSLHTSPFVFSILFASYGLVGISGNYLGIKLRESYSLHWNIRFGCILMIVGALFMLAIYLYQGFTLLSLAAKRG